MTGSALFDFFIACIALVVIVFLIMLAIDRMSPDDTFKKIARVAVGATALIVFLLAVKGVFFGGGGALTTGPGQILEFAIGMIVILVVWYLANIIVEYFQVFVNEVKYILGAIAIIAMLVIAQRALMGGKPTFLTNLPSIGTKTEVAK